MLAIGAAPDRYLELLWQHHRTCDVFPELAALGFAAVTTPNFSYFLDAPRPQILYNFRRILLTAERMSAAGIKVVPHLNALTIFDWQLWISALREHTEINAVAVDFQTGLRSPALGMPFIQKLRELEQRLSRKMHVVALAGGQYVKTFRDMDATFTLVDAEPFLKTLHRKKIGEDKLIENIHTLDGDPLDELLEENLRKKERRIALRWQSQGDQYLLGLSEKGLPTIGSPAASALVRRVSKPVKSGQRDVKPKFSRPTRGTLEKKLELWKDKKLPEIPSEPAPPVQIVDVALADGYPMTFPQRRRGVTPVTAPRTL
jgi:hypothetical protein